MCLPPQCCSSNKPSGFGEEQWPPVRVCCSFYLQTSPLPRPQVPSWFPSFHSSFFIVKVSIVFDTSSAQFTEACFHFDTPPLQLYLLHKQYWSQTITGLMSKIKSMPHLSPAEGLKVQFNHRKINKTLLGGGLGLVGGDANYKLNKSLTVQQF